MHGWHGAWCVGLIAGDNYVALDPGRPRPRRGPRESWSRGRSRGVVVVASGKLQELSL
jgi:hypothetical protein